MILQRNPAMILVVVVSSVVLAGCAQQDGGKGGCGGMARDNGTGNPQVGTCETVLEVEPGPGIVKVVQTGTVDDMPTGWNRPLRWDDMRLAASVGIQAWQDAGPRHTIAANQEFDLSMILTGTITVGQSFRLCAFEPALTIRVWQAPETKLDGRGGDAIIQAREMLACPTTQAAAPPDTQPQRPNEPPRELGTVAAGSIAVSVSAASIVGLLLSWPSVRLLAFAVVGGFSKIRRDDILDAPNRSAILEYARQNPGSRASAARRTLEMPPSTFAYHVRRLAAAGHLRIQRQGLTLRLSLPGAVDSARIDDLRERVRSLRRARPDDSAAELARELGRSPRTVRHHLKWIEREERQAGGPSRISLLTNSTRDAPRR